MACRWRWRSVRPPATVPAIKDDDAGNAWTRFTRELWRDLRDLVRIQNMERPDLPLLAPAQAYFLRENFKLRLLSARLALLAHDEKSFRADLKAAREWIERYFDTRHNQVAHAAGVLRALHAAEISIEVPGISGALDALRHLRAAGERGAR